MTRRTFHADTPLQALLVEQALLLARHLEQTADDAPDGQVLARVEAAAVPAGRELTRQAVEAALQHQAERAEKGAPGRTCPGCRTSAWPKRSVRRHVSQVGDVERPDLAQFPRFAEAVAVTCVLGPGDLLFLPSGWWHTTRMLTASISVAFNTLNASNWAGFAQDLCDDLRPYHPRLTRLYAAYLAAHGGLHALKDRLTWRPAAQSGANATV